MRFRVERAREIAAKHGLAQVQEIAAFFNTTETTYSRVARGLTDPGERFIADVLSSRPGDPDITWESLFEVVETSEVAAS